jgi:predicted MFS family arabinose efflux permease
VRSPPTAPSAAKTGSAWSSGAARWTLGLLVAINVVSQIDRQIMYILVEPIRKELELSDGQIGLLVGLAFALFHTLAGIPIARIADRWSRRNLIVACLVIWSAMTALCGAARGFAELFFARMGVGIGEAGCSPSAQSLIADTFPIEARGRAIATYQLGVPIGLLIGLAFGGYLADQVGWRSAFFVVGLPGLILASITRFTLREPPRGRFETGGRTNADVEPMRDVLRFLWRLVTMRHVLIAASLQTLTVAAHGAFNAAFLQRFHGLSMTEAGISLGLVTGVAGAVGTYSGGWFGDRLGRRDPRWYIWSPMIGGLGSVPFSVLAYTTSSAKLAVLALAGVVLGSFAYAGVVHAVTQSLVTSRMRAVTAAVALFAMNLLGYGGGPYLAGLLSDWLGGPEALRPALITMNGVMIWACIHYGWATRTYRSDLASGHR